MNEPTPPVTRRIDVVPTDPASDPRAAFDRFYLDTHASMVRALAIAVGDDGLGREAADEAFTRALQRWRTVRAHRNPAGWVYRVGLNWARSRRRRRRREVMSDAPFEHGGGREHAAPEQIRDRAVLAAVRELPVDQRSVVVARYYLDWSEDQIAAALDIAPGTVKSRASRALQQLSTILEDPR